MIRYATVRILWTLWGKIRKPYKKDMVQALNWPQWDHKEKFTEWHKTCMPSQSDRAFNNDDIDDI